MAVFQFEQLSLDEVQKVHTVLGVGWPGYSWFHIYSLSIASNRTSWAMQRAQ